MNPFLILIFGLALLIFRASPLETYCGDQITEVSLRVSQCSQIFQKLAVGAIMRDSENQSGLAQYLKVNVAVVEVRYGESQEEAWRRYLADHPESVGVRVKIFHYPSQA